MSLSSGNRKNSFVPSDRVGISICLAISFIAWFLTKMSKEYLDEYDFAIRYEIPEHLTTQQLPSDRLSTELRAKGWAFLRMALSRSDDTLVVNTGEYLQQNISSRLALANHLRDQITDQIEIRSITPEQLSFRLVEKSRKKIPVVLAGPLPLDGQHQMRESPRFEPDSITIFGPAETIAGVTQWYVEYEGEPLNADARISVALQPTENGITFDTASIDLVTAIEQITEKEIYVPITLPDSLTGKVQVFPDEALVRCTVGLSKFDDISASQFTLVARPGNAKNTFDVSVVDKPDMVELLSYSPRQVEVFRINQ